MCLVKAETVWSSLTTVRSVVAELRPVTGKTHCAGRFWPTQTMRASQRGAQGQGNHVGVARHDWKGSTAATVSGGVDRWRSRAERKNGGRRRRLLLFIDEKETSGVDSARTSSPRCRLRVTARESGEEGRRHAAAWCRRLQIEFLNYLHNCH